MTTISGHLTDFPRHDTAPIGEPTGVMPYRTYWLSWGGLLALTALMLLTETLPLARAAGLTVLLAAMLVKAGVIAAWFMHLRFERPGLVYSVVGATVLTAVALFALIAPDGVAILRHAAH
jgi:cytochrome c oxidase subunit IV